MKNRFHKWIFPLILVVMLIVGAILYPTLPEMVPSHWGLTGEVDAYLPRGIAILVIPAITGFIWVIMALVPYLDPRRDQYKKFEKSYTRMQYTLGIFMLIMYVLMLTQYDHPTIMIKGIFFGIALMFTLIGNELGRFRQTYFTGIRTPWTLADERVWKITHRVGARWMTAVGAINMILIPFLHVYLAIAMLLVTIIGVTLALVVLSYYVYQRLN